MYYLEWSHIDLCIPFSPSPEFKEQSVAALVFFLLVYRFFPYIQWSSKCPAIPGHYIYFNSVRK